MYPVTELEGAVVAITSGAGKEIVWTLTQDVAWHQYGEVGGDTDTNLDFLGK